MSQLTDEFRAQAALSAPEGGRARVRACAAPVHVALHVPRLRTIHSLVVDWRAAVDQYTVESEAEEPLKRPMRRRELAAVTAAALDGRVSLWLHNSCAGALRVGQEGTDEIVPLGPAARLAYRWRSPTAPKRLRFALAGPATDWHWTSSVPFTAGSYRVRLEDAEELGGKAAPGAGVYAHVRVEGDGARRTMHVGGRLALANMLRYGLLYKVRARCPDSSQWRTVCAGELEPESVGRSVMCGAECEMSVKVKFAAHSTGWSGEIPLKECPKQNVPWLVKVPSDGDLPYISVWCRVVRASGDGRVLATVWPLYVLHSHLPLDTDVLIVTDTVATFLDNQEEMNSAPLVQAAPGRGASTHLVAPGTTAARHSLSFQYRHIECPVTREAVPLHYGVTDQSVFEKRTPVASIDEVMLDIHSWLDRSGRDASSAWPYSVVAKYWPGKWQPALLQPKCDVTVRYQAVRAGGGCCLELQLCPLALLCNAAPIALTLRAHDAAPLCKLEAGAAIAPPAIILKKPFFISTEVGRETFVSSQLELSAEPPGRYAAPPPGRVTLDRATPFVVHCNQKVALLTMYYEIKQDINVLGVSTTYVLINNLQTNILVSALAVPLDGGVDVDLRPKTFKVVEPTKEGSIHGMPLCRFWLRGRFRGGGDPAELAAFLCLALPANGYPAGAPAPVRLGEPPYRRAIALCDAEGRPVPVVVTQLKADGRWLVGVAEDPCPQFLVHNRTRTPLALAQPRCSSIDPSTSRIEVVPECLGAKWYCTIPAGASTHYSSPAHCARYPPPAPAPQPADAVQLLTLARAKEEGEPQWCAWVAAAEGSQLVQLAGGVTVKLRVRTQPHSTVLELRDVDQNDISASDIRNRLFESHTSKDTVVLSRKEALSSSRKLVRTHADEKLLDTSLAPEDMGDDAVEPFEDDGGRLVLATTPSDAQLSVNTAPDDERSKRASIDTVLQPFLSGPPSSSLQVIKDTVRVVEPDQEGDEYEDVQSTRDPASEMYQSQISFMYPEITRPDWEEGSEPWARFEWARVVASALSVELAASADARPLLALHVTRAALLVLAEPKRTKTTLSIAGIQIDNLQYENGQFDFGVVASTPTEVEAESRWPPLWTMLVDRSAFSTREESARLLLRAQHDTWTAGDNDYTELTELEVSVGPLALYVEDAYVSALAELARLALPAPPDAPALPELRALQRPLRLQALCVHPIDLTLTLHTAVRMYIALDQSPLHLGAFRLQRAMTSVEQLTHALTVHYLSAAILGAGWVVGGLELLGAPGALAARVGGASGGVRGVASAAAAALVRSLSAWAGSLARNLDLLAGDEEHARRAAAARRRPPPSLVAGLVAGITNFAINILGAVGGLAHHPLVGVAVGETASGAAALRRGLLGALAKPLSATADLVAYAGHGLLTQTGWDPVPQPRASVWAGGGQAAAGWRRDCVRWAFRLAELSALAGFEVLLDNAPLQLLLTHKFLVVADLETEKIVEMIDLKFCELEPYEGAVIQLRVKQMKRHVSKASDSRADEDDEYQVSAAAMARVARYTGAAGANATADAGAARVLSLHTAPARAIALHAALAAAVRNNSGAHFPLL